ncbi:MAG: methanogenesis marker 16 metalloprotein [Methanomassiliicoccaceae archaeon]|jgi:putative methanogenesis marker 16 metalloprotein|nr:methanogenesis marker 16 metalloprotein [Methanomassiliicoccaceae archaeon]
MKTVPSIDRLIKEKRAKVFTASEIKDMIRRGEIPSADDVDVVTTGTFGIMSGTMAIFTLPVAPPGSFGKADTIKLNGVPGYPGPCPNENLGLVDCVVYGTSKYDMNYGGGHLFKDLVKGDTIQVEAVSDGKVFRKEMTLHEIPFARMVVTRGAFMNYTAFVNPEESAFDTIFSVTGMAGPLKEASVSGCGEINPLQNDPSRAYLKEGAPILLNGADGRIIGEGTRSTSLRPNLSAAADMKDMDAGMMGGFITSAGPECMTSFAAAIPIIDENALKGVSVTDENIRLPIADIQTRVPFSSDDYGSVWNGTCRKIMTDEKKCISCYRCIAQNNCPVKALTPSSINVSECVVCGSCIRTCTGNVFTADLGSLDINGSSIPITLRQSDRNRAEELTLRLKERILDGKWNIGGI